MELQLPDYVDRTFDDVLHEHTDTHERNRMQIVKKRERERENLNKYTKPHTIDATCEIHRATNKT